MGEFKDILRQLRMEEKLTQDELAERLGISRSAVSMYERGQREPDFETLEAIADYFNVDMNYLTGWTDDPYDYDRDPDSRMDSIPRAQFYALMERYHDSLPDVWKAWCNMEDEAMADYYASRHQSGHPAESDVKAAFFDGLADDLTPEEREAYWADARAYLEFKLQSRKKKKE